MFITKKSKSSLRKPHVSKHIVKREEKVVVEPIVTEEKPKEVIKKKTVSRAKKEVVLEPVISEENKEKENE